VLYLETSAAAKLVVAEPESKALRTLLTEAAAPVVACDLIRTELLRATRRAAPDQMAQARAVLDGLTLLTVTAATFERAAELQPPTLRSPDAIHLAAALELGDALDGFIVYDDRLAEAAALHGLLVHSPGRAGS
jgi:predicted nucleic acid-binding protein